MPFDVLYADPPWLFNDTGSRIAPENEACANGYSQMRTADICDLPVAGMGKPDSVLFLWSTWTHIMDGDVNAGIPSSMQRVCHAWGYVPKVCVPWVKLSDRPGVSTASYTDFPSVSWVFEHGMKIQIGAGHYVRACVEPLVIAVRGSRVVSTDRRLPGVGFVPEGFLAAPRPGGHSTKPFVVRDLIEHMYPAPNTYLELFARRCPPRDRWKFIGDQAKPESDG